MQTIKIITLLLLFVTSNAEAQKKVSSSDQTRTVEINNENGELSISFLNGVITEFIVNDTPVAKERYNEYQDIIDDFSGEKVSPPPAPVPPANEDQVGELRTMMIAYLMNNGVINSFQKYKVQLKRKSLEVDGQKVSPEIHDACLDFFHEVYGHRLNSGTEVKFKKSRNKSTSSVSIGEGR